jgi:anti-sigma factor RsiW
MYETLDDAVLVAYVDGELDPRRRREVEQRLRADAEASDKVRLMQRSARALQGAYDEVFDRPVPERILEAFEAARAETATTAGGRPQPRWRQVLATVGQRGFGPSALAAACAAALVVGVALGRVDSPFGEDVFMPASVTTTAEPATAGGLLPVQAAALESGAAGVAVDYERADLGVKARFTPLEAVDGPEGLLCRGFRDEVAHAAATVASVGLACRGADGHWAALSVQAGPGD